MEHTTEAPEVKVVSLPRIGDPAPQFEADTTFGHLKLEDFKGSWLILFFRTLLILPLFVSPSLSHSPRFRINCVS